MFYLLIELGSIVAGDFYLTNLLLDCDGLLLVDERSDASTVSNGCDVVRSSA